LNSDESQHELMSMLSSSAFSYQDGFSKENALNFAASYLLQQQQQQQQRQEQQKQTFDTNAHPSSLSPLISESNMSPTNPFQHHQISSPTDYSQYAQQQYGRHAPLNDAPSPEGFTTLEMAGSFDPYLPPNSRVPTGIRQALGDVSKIFEFQAKAGLLDDEASMFDNRQQPSQQPSQQYQFSQQHYSLET
ncbi:hypothetical protein BGZ93_001421, partial [Podila epicladia]